MTVISLELLTVFIAGPIAVWICDSLRKRRSDSWFWMVVLATGELYGGESNNQSTTSGNTQLNAEGFMTFMPEWLSGSPNLDTSNIMYT